MRFLRAIAVGCLAGVGVMTLALPALADFRICNRTESRVGIAFGYKDGDHWTTEGWWLIPPNTCETLIRGQLIARYYYLYAQDYDQGGEWSGKAFLCTRDKEFTIQGVADCLARGYNRTGFFEVDTLDQKNWTVQLTEQTQAPRSQRTPISPFTPQSNQPSPTQQTR